MLRLLHTQTHTHNHRERPTLAHLCRIRAYKQVKNADCERCCLCNDTHTRTQPYEERVHWVFIHIFVHIINWKLTCTIFFIKNSHLFNFCTVCATRPRRVVVAFCYCFYVNGYVNRTINSKWHCWALEMALLTQANQGWRKKQLLLMLRLFGQVQIV